MKIGIIAAEAKEKEALKNHLENVKEEKYYNLLFEIGLLNNHDIVLVECGTGKVNSARTAQILIDKYNPDYIINIGSAGGVNPELKVKDIVIANKLIQYDFDATAMGYKPGEVCDVGIYFECDSKLVELCKEVLDEESDKDYNTKIGLIGSADKFCSGSDFAKQVYSQFGMDCVEMEGAAIAQVCVLDKVPFLVIRGISDTAQGNNFMDFRTYLELASKQAADIVDKLVAKL